MDVELTSTSSAAVFSSSSQHAATLTCEDILSYTYYTHQQLITLDSPAVSETKTHIMIRILPQTMMNHLSPRSRWPRRRTNNMNNLNTLRIRPRNPINSRKLPHPIRSQNYISSAPSISHHHPNISKILTDTRNSLNSRIPIGSICSVQLI